MCLRKASRGFHQRGGNKAKVEAKEAKDEAKGEAKGANPRGVSSTSDWAYTLPVSVRQGQGQPAPAWCKGHPLGDERSQHRHLGGNLNPHKHGDNVCH